MQKPMPGQRWISEAEPELGLGILMDITNRYLTIRFDSSDCTRLYTLKGAPLKRIIFKTGDEIVLRNHTKLKIESLSESKGLLYYSDGRQMVCEKDLSDTICFSMPQDRLFAGILDSNPLFDLRYRLLTSKARYDASFAKGFFGGQVQLLPHQFFIADTVTSRFIPRVLLSDETGLGKTIEACLILHKLLITQRAQRILIIVPESLTHQWFIELYRKFNLSFMIFSEDYCETLFQKSSRESSEINPFYEHQLGIVSLDFLKHQKWQPLLLDAKWDMVVIDEAHHIADDKQTHDFIARLSKKTFGLMLLTATPEQMGMENHFLHLKLLDPERYFDFNTFLSETRQYKKTLSQVKKLIQNKSPIDHILDSYGPGRVIFRNKRNVIQGFPKRVIHLKGFTASPSRVSCINREFFEPENITSYHYIDDPRIEGLVELAKQKKKCLVICSSREKVAAIETALLNHIQLDVARFDETMTLLQRDRSAAWFSRKDGAQFLICSEIGSEGRNFQFVHHLVLFDLPRNPELLEQRIGRIDRIGQTHDIQIHVLFILASAYDILARWYMDGLNLFKKNVNGVHIIFKRFEPALEALLIQTKNNMAIDETGFANLVAQTRSFCRQVDKRLSQGKNILLEMNSFKPASAEKMIQSLLQAETESRVEKLLTSVLDHYRIETDFIDKTLFKLNFKDLIDEKFPAATHRSDTLTFNRNTAIARDDVDFFSWDHPFVHQTFDYFITNGTGSCVTASLLGQKNQGILLETVFIVECVAPHYLNLDRYLMAAPIRIIVDHNLTDMTEENEFTFLWEKLIQDKTTWYKDMEQVRKILIPSMMGKSHQIATTRSQIMIEQGVKRIQTILGKEITRLLELQKINPDIREEEIHLAQTRMDSLLEHLTRTRIRLDALRLIRVL